MLVVEAKSVDMDRWQNRVAVVTGASSGIGAVIAADLVKSGLKVVALARREDRLKENQKLLPSNLRSSYYPIKCDLTKEDDVKKAFNWIDQNLGGTDILVNNAGIFNLVSQLIDPDNTNVIRDTVNTNIMAVVYCVREAFNSMKRRNFDGHVVIINAGLGHMVPVGMGFKFNIYPATKYAVTAMVETYRQEFANAGTKVKVTDISPGATDTEMPPDSIRGNIPMLKAEDVSNAILYVLGTPPHVQVHEVIMKPIGARA